MIRSFGGKTPRIAESAYVSEAAYVIGDVEIGEGSGVFPGAVIRGDFASIKIGNNNLIGNNSTLLDNAEIGNHCIIAAGSLVSQGMKVPDYSMVVGIPGKIRDVGDRMKRRVQDGPSAYSELVKRYKQEGL